ncbi:MAG: MmcQ/YjbR family DNA-binding protein [Firmicutes bacterium]|nr:MmcQ/YjbR family DNA-binding protein [Bacillota bacterium]
MTKREIINLCLELPDVYEDYPFDLITADPTAWAAIRHKGNYKSFAFITVYGGRLIINLKCDPMDAIFLRQMFKGVTAGYHMNKEHWNTIYLDGGVPLELLKDMIRHSYELSKSKRAGGGIRHQRSRIRGQRMEVRE